MNYGIIKAFGKIQVGTWPVFRLLVMVNDMDFVYVYIPAQNYKLRERDIVSWNDDYLYWHTEARAVRFDLLETGVTI